MYWIRILLSVVNRYPAIYIVYAVFYFVSCEKNGKIKIISSFSAIIVCFVINLLNNKTIILLSGSHEISPNFSQVNVSGNIHRIIAKLTGFQPEIENWAFTKCLVIFLTEACYSATTLPSKNSPFKSSISLQTLFLFLNTQTYTEVTGIFWYPYCFCIFFIVIAKFYFGFYWGKCS